MISAEEARNIANRYDGVKQEIENINAIIKCAAFKGEYKVSLPLFSKKAKEYLIINGYKIFGYWIFDFPIISWKSKKTK